MALGEPSREEVEEAIRYMEELRKDPEKHNRWLDSALEEALKGEETRERGWHEELNTD